MHKAIFDQLGQDKQKQSAISSRATAICSDRTGVKSAEYDWLNGQNFDTQLAALRPLILTSCSEPGLPPHHSFGATFIRSLFSVPTTISS